MSRRQEVTAAFVGALVLGCVLVLIVRSDNVAAGFSAVFAFGLLVVAIWAAQIGVGQLLAVREDSRRRTRPMMSAELRPAPHVRGAHLLVIRNFGASVARWAEVRFDPPLPPVAPEEEATSLVAALRDRYAQPIATIVPGAELDNIWFFGVPDGGDPEKYRDKVGLERMFRVTISYRDDDLNDDEAPYRDYFDLNVDILLKRTYAESSGHPDNVLKDLAGHVERVAVATDAIARSVTGSDPQPPLPDISELLPPRREADE